MHPSKLESVIAMTEPERYDYFVRKIADVQVVWGLHNDGWATGCTDDGGQVVAFWPERAFAAACAQGEWTSYGPKEILLDAFLDKWLPGMERDSLLVAVFPTAESKGVFVEPRRLAERIHAENMLYDRERRGSRQAAGEQTCWKAVTLPKTARDRRHDSPETLREKCSRIGRKHEVQKL